MDNAGLSKDDVAYLFSNLETLNQLAEQCIDSKRQDAFVEMNEPEPSSIVIDRLQTNPVIAADAQSTVPGREMATRATTSVNVTPCGNRLLSPVTNAPSHGHIQSRALEATDSVNRGSHNRQLISNASNCPHTARESDR